MREKIQREALEKILGYKRAGLAMSVGAGKTKVALDYINHFYTDSLRVLIVAPKLSIFDTWKHEITKFNYSYLLEHTEFTTYLSLDKNSLEYDIVCLDEAHNLLWSHDNWLSQFKGRILGLSGTFPRYEHSEKGKMVEKYCPVVFEYSTDDAIKHDILNDYRIIVHPLKLSSKKDLWITGKAGKGWMTSEMDNYRYWTSRVDNAGNGKELQIMRIMRMRALMNFKTKEKYAAQLLSTITNPCILFGNTQEQVDKLCAFTYHSKNVDSEENLELFRTGKILKLGAVLQLNEGINVPVKEEIILHSYGNERKLSQRIGRGLRLNPDETVTIHVLMFENTVDKTWVQKALEDFDPDKIVYKQSPVNKLNVMV